MATLRIKNVQKSFGLVPVLKGIDVDVQDGEFVALVGPSGCGKSTLLRMIAGLESITHGQLMIDDKVVNHLPPRDRNIAMVFQSYALYPHMTVADNLRFSLKLAKRPKDEIEKSIRRAAEILGLSELLDRYPRQLSGGQRQRVAMGRAIVREPKVFLFDEPLSNLDAKLRVQMRSEIKTLHQRLNTTTIYVTHDQVEAMTMADRIVIMRDGLVEQIGTPLQLYDNPRNLFVAGFIGSPAMNFLDGTKSGDMFVTASGALLPMPKADGVATTYGIRPEHIQISQSGTPMTVVLVEPTGAETMVALQHGEQRLTALIRERISVRVGDSINIAIAPEHVVLFDSDGMNLAAQAAL